MADLGEKAPCVSSRGLGMGGHPGEAQSVPGESIDPLCREGGSVEPKLRARIGFLLANMATVFVSLCVGWRAYRSTNSLTVKLDLITYSLDLTALAANLGVEWAKGATRCRRTILKLDVCGCIASVVLNVGASFYCIYCCLLRQEDAAKGDVKDSHVSNAQIMLWYSFLSMAMNVSTIFGFWYLKGAMYPDGLANEDRLNIVSSLVWTLTDIVVTVSVFGTSCWLLLHKEHWWESFRTRLCERARIDIVGCFAICTLIVVCSLRLLLEVWRVLLEIAEQDVGVGEARSWKPAGYGSTLRDPEAKA